MRASKAHGFVAWLFDLYFACFVVGGVVALVLALSGSVGNIGMALIVLGVALVGSIGYHLGFARRIAWCSPGERVAGRYAEGHAEGQGVAGGKAWLNPYSRTRWPLFAVMLLVTVLAGNTWDGIGRGSELRPATVLLGGLALAILSIGLVRAGRGSAWWMAAPALFMVLVAISVLVPSPTDPELPPGMRTVTGSFFAGVALLCLVVGAVHARFSEPAASTGPA